MMKNIVKMICLLFVLSGTSNAQDSDINLSNNLKKDIAEFLISKDVLKETEDITRYFKTIYITNLNNNDFKIDEEIGVYAVGASISHTPTFLLLQNKNQYDIYEINNLKSLLNKVLELLEKKEDLEDQTIVNYINNIFKAYNNNLAKSQQGFVIK
ncbi:hypothetical protein ATE84_4546 [Aquimarina sp. MAR_2010_214]|uniref:hypothetical protein n=1 Tax=Aquimarina sp. MAR_2010_214 TaxID=1250026 RepID=UPI000C70A242|nr:hypothetical protein [Aquimarina sp. MAR_2010_214]PKV49572.1 hypothetical protein ATE84_1603 [Aquimarina sp. MAR_2010_214]PKV49579.1 hypothetical protein ATE84_1610 [Aquimarina sp. MAR_2010_214]PKV52424.1 hypothetical protein ATE84_4539 [Aquimarina sp. MAR_2010_214]PKV52431.1 hypothetical protein ATE84_4546 [Aquimarina sp. MAR_2010_214]